MRRRRPVRVKGKAAPPSVVGQFQIKPVRVSLPFVDRGESAGLERHLRMLACLGLALLDIPAALQVAGSLGERGGSTVRLVEMSAAG